LAVGPLRLFFSGVLCSFLVDGPDSPEIKSRDSQVPAILWVNEPHWENFAVAFAAFPFLRYLGNSIIVTGAILLCQIVTVIPAAYAFARYTFPGKRLLFGLTLASVMITGAAYLFARIYSHGTAWD
jgi:sn-glycerol 3-phosphate transport system permease protein